MAKDYYNVHVPQSLSCGDMMHVPTDTVPCMKPVRDENGRKITIKDPETGIKSYKIEPMITWNKYTMDYEPMVMQNTILVKKCEYKKLYRSYHLELIKEQEEFMLRKKREHDDEFEPSDKVIKLQRRILVYVTDQQERIYLAGASDEVREMTDEEKLKKLEELSKLLLGVHESLSGRQSLPNNIVIHSCRCLQAPKIHKLCVELGLIPTLELLAKIKENEW